VTGESETVGGLRAVDELPVQPAPTVPGWSDDYVFQGYDFDRRVGLQVHVTTWDADPAIRNEYVMIFLPDGAYAVHKGAGVATVNGGVAGTLLEFVCEAPARRWGIRYHGPARPATPAELSSGSMSDGAEQLLDVDVVYTSAFPAWIHGGVSDEASFASHYEQPGRVEGTISFAGQKHEIRGFAFRDHNRGPRSLTDLCSYSWVHGELLDGRAFSSFTLSHGPSPKDITARYSKAAIWDGGKILEAECGDSPILLSPIDPGEQYEITLHAANSVAKVKAYVQRSLPFTISRGYDYFHGTASGPGDFVTFVEPTKFEFAGVVGYGLVERLAPLSGF
jgi:hypothetical protein